MDESLSRTKKALTCQKPQEEQNLEGFGEETGLWGPDPRASDYIEDNLTLRGMLSAESIQHLFTYFRSYLWEEVGNLVWNQ